MAQIPQNLGPFQFEPRLNEEQIRVIRRRQEQAELNNNGDAPGPAHDDDGLNDRDRKLQDRLVGLIPVGDWCQCQRCLVPQNPTAKMIQCCHEHPALEEKLENDQCIVDHPDFESVCLTPAVLHIVINSMIEVRGYGVVDDWTNRLHRYVAYRAYAYWIHQRLGRYNRRVTPACVVIAIRDRFPEERDEDYVSFKEAEDEVGDAWRL